MVQVQEYSRFTSSFSYNTKRVQKIHMTGEITLRGKVLFQWNQRKILAAKRATLENHFMS
jgi:ATP-dependent Lon protease